MATNQISFGGNILPCTVERFPAIKKAQRKFRQYKIPGRNGDIFFQDDAYENVIQSYEIYAGDGTYGSQHPWTNLAKYLYLDGYQELKDTYDPDHFRKAVFNGPIDVENSWNTHGRATIEFNCRPERYLNSGNTPVTFAAGASLNMRTVNFADLSADIQAMIQANGLPENNYFAFDFPTDADIAFDDFFFLQNAPNISTGGAEYNVGISCDVGDETTATADIAVMKAGHGHKKYGPEITSADYGYIYMTGRTILIASTITNGEVPIAIFQWSVQPTWRPYGTTMTITNNYQPAYPSITLHRVAAYTGEMSALQIGDRSIWITFDTDNPWYFIDTENFSATKAATENDDRELANNVRIDPGLMLEQGANTLYASAYFDAVITPNWWEL